MTFFFGFSISRGEAQAPCPPPLDTRLFKDVVNSNITAKLKEHLFRSGIQYWHWYNYSPYKLPCMILADFSFTDSNTLSRLFNTYCTNIYGSPLWKHFDRKLLEPFYIAWRKCIRRVWKIPFTSHNVLLPYIHNTIAFNVILEKRCIKLLWTLFNSGYDIYIEL